MFVFYKQVIYLYVRTFTVTFILMFGTKLGWVKISEYRENTHFFKVNKMRTQTVRSKSNDVPKETLAAFRKYVKGFRYMSECMRDSGFDRDTIQKILKGETVAATTIERLEQLLNLKAA